jgi:hypothetical protein
MRLWGNGMLVGLNLSVHPASMFSATANIETTRRVIFDEERIIKPR